MAVLSLVKYRNRETVELFDSLSMLAAHGEVNDVMISFRGPDGRQRVALTGLYLADEKEALRAAARIAIHLTEFKRKARVAPG